MTVTELLRAPTGGDAAAAPRPRRAAGREAALVCCVVAVSMLVHGVNMLRYPYLENDEGTYVAQAWSVLHQGRLAPYTYFYDHAPGGWLQIALWQLATGGVHGVFGDAIASGRVFMLLLQGASTALVVLTGRRLSGRLWVGLLAGLLFALSPYGLMYHRRVLLDNIAAFWMLVSFLLLLSRPLRLQRVWLSALALAVAVWSKEIAVALVPALAVLAARQAARSTRLLAAAGWVTVAVSVISFYPLMALLRGEMFPTGSLLGGSKPHVSLLCSLQWQASRGTDGGIGNPASAFWKTAVHWAHLDPLLVVGSAAAAAVFIVLARRDPRLSMLGWVIVSFWLFLGRGGLILDFYLIPLLPFLAVAVAALVWRSTDLASGLLRQHRLLLGRALAVAASLGCAGAMIWQLAQPVNRVAWDSDPVAGQEQAVAWAERHLPAGSRVVIDMYMWVDLHTANAPGEHPIRRAHWYWKVADDPAIRERVFHNNWRKVDYVITTPQLVQDTETQGFPIIQAALNHSRIVARFNTGTDVVVRKVDPAIATHDFTWKKTTAPPLPSCMTS